MCMLTYRGLKDDKKKKKKTMSGKHFENREMLLLLAIMIFKHGKRLRGEFALVPLAAGESNQRWDVTCLSSTRIF